MRWLAFLVLAAACAVPGAGAAPEMKREEQMVEKVAGYARLIGPEQADDPRVLAALAAVPRAEFVPAPWRHAAHDDSALPIAHGQTISQPTIVALMTHLLGVKPGDRVLEVGTGSGYQAAVLAAMGAEVVSVEIIPALAAEARERLARLGYRGVAVHTGDGGLGWPEAAPYDAIIVTAAAPRVPPALVAELRPGGRLVIPVGPEGGIQQLRLVEKAADGSLAERTVTDVRFVPLTGTEREPPAPAGEPR